METVAMIIGIVFGLVMLFCFIMVVAATIRNNVDSSLSDWGAIFFAVLLIAFVVVAASQCS